MSLIDFLKKQGFVKEDDTAANKGKPAPNTTQNRTEQQDNPMPVYFPAHNNAAMPSAMPSFDATSQLAGMHNTTDTAALDPASIKFYEDALISLNLPGPDYFEFRQQLVAMNKKMQGKAGTTPDLIFQTVLMNFDTQNVSVAKLIDAANFYKTSLISKRDEFLKGADGEKENQLNNRQNVATAHANNITQFQNQLNDLTQQIKKIEQSLSTEQRQAELDKTLGQEAIEKIEKAKVQISMACDVMNTHIDEDIQRLNSAN